ncbi:MAG: transcription-repair coupling factor [Coriobacteriia bacterium]|nr:transcription-repair coupling factor [Coriobacteriia bacterium]
MSTSQAPAASRIIHPITTTPAFAGIVASLHAGDDVTLALPSFARDYFIAAQFLQEPACTLVVEPTAPEAQRAARALATLVGASRVLIFAERSDLPWQDHEAAPAELLARARALTALDGHEPVLIVTAAAACLRLMVPRRLRQFAPLQFTLRQTVDFATIAARLVQMGYARQTRADVEGSFAWQGDTLSVYQPLPARPLRIDFFDEEVESIRTYVPGSGQLVSPLEAAALYPVCDLAPSKAAARAAAEMLAPLAATQPQVAQHADQLAHGIRFAGIGRYLPLLQADAEPLAAWIDDEVRTILVEPKVIFDNAIRRMEQLGESARSAGFRSLAHLRAGASSRGRKTAASALDVVARPWDPATRNRSRSRGPQAEQPAAELLQGLFIAPARLDFGAGARLQILTLAGNAPADVRLAARTIPPLRRDEQLVAFVRRLISEHYRVAFALPDRHHRQHVTDVLVSASMTVGGPDDLDAGVICLLDADLPGGCVIEEARLALLTTAELFPESARRARAGAGAHAGANVGAGANAADHGSIDKTLLTFPFKPGDYVVHVNYGIALFTELTRRTVDEVTRDYLHLQYAAGDTLYTPVDQIDKISKYVGADGSAPKVTRLGGKSWLHAIEKARASARQMAFDLTNLYARRSHITGYAFSPDTLQQHEMEARFTYEETADQRSAIADVKADMESTRPMDRLIIGDVGYGKTEVAIRAAFKAICDHKQVMVLCPTTILAQQHFTSFSERFEGFNATVEVLSRFRSAAEIRRALEGFADGTVDVLVGTHRLLSADVVPRDLGLLIIDEEQRFGVQHKEQLKNFREQIDVLAMSATPIPRTLQMSLSGVRDLSLINTAPANRHPIHVQVQAASNDIIAHAIRHEIGRGGQVYYISNRVRNIDDALRRATDLVPEARIGVAHGQMGDAELEQVMERFAAGQIDVLLSTTIVESGIDNPHTNTLIIEDSQRLGLSQLYQLKGRVGRSHVHAYAYFLYPSDGTLTTRAVERLQAIAEHDELGSGIKIAMRDLEIRGAGSLVGAEQSGQLSAVGFDLFATMLAAALADEDQESADDKITPGVILSSAETVAFPDIRVEISVPAFLPEEYLPALGARVLWYRRIAAARNREHLDALTEKLCAEHGALPEPARNLIALARIRLGCAALGATGIAVAPATPAPPAAATPTPAAPPASSAAAAAPGHDLKIKGFTPSAELREELAPLGVTYEARSRILSAHLPYGKNVADASATLVDAIVFQSEQ